jgi:DNA polymerase-3 subunit gamma/tau
MPVEPAQSQAHSPAADATEQGYDLAQVWQQVLTHLPLSTQALLRQHGQLIALSPNLARIRIRSQPLLEMVKKGLPSVKAAFERVLNGEVTVSLELPSAAPPAEPPAENKPPPRPDLGNRPPAPSPTPAPEISLTPQQPKPPEMPPEKPPNPSAGAAPPPVDPKREDRLEDRREDGLEDRLEDGLEDRLEERRDAIPTNGEPVDAPTAGRWEETEDVKFAVERMLQSLKGQLITQPLPDQVDSDAPAPDDAPSPSDYDLPLYGSSDEEESYLEDEEDSDDVWF